MIDDTILSIPGFSKILFKDESFFRELFQTLPVQYSYNFLYLLRASRSADGLLGFKYVDKDIVAVLGIRNESIYIIPIIDKTKGVKLSKVITELHNKIPFHIYLKKFCIKNFSNVNVHNSMNISGQILEDDTLPETIIPLTKLFDQNGEISRQAKRFNKLVNRFKKFNMQLTVVNDINEIAQADIEEFFAKDRNKYLSYLQIIRFLYAHGKDPQYKTQVFLYQNQVVGVYIAARLATDAMGMYCGVTSKDKQGITEWMDWYFFKDLISENVKTLYLGGSENAGINYYVKKLLPEKPPYDTKTIQYL